MSVPASSARLTIESLAVEIDGQRLVHGASLAVQPGTVHCLVGDSGSGKTLTSLAAVGLLPRTARATGSIRLAGDDDLLRADERRWSEVRGRSIGYVGQNALGCLHPAFRIGTQLVEAIRRHQRVAASEARSMAVAALASVDLPDPERIARSHPAQLSGGMCQRVALAIAMCNRPQVLIADEPTTALDHDTQGRILDLLRRRVEQDGLGLLLITHDHEVVSAMADEVTTIVDGTTAATPRWSPPERVDVRPTSPAPAAGTTEHEPALEIIGVGKAFDPARRGRRRRTEGTRVLRDVTITAHPGTTIGLVGRSGAGKTTLARIVAGTLTPSEGQVRIAGQPVTGRDRVGRVAKAGLVQYVFQDPFGSLNPRRSVRAQVAEPLVATGVRTAEAADRAHDLLTDVGLTDAEIARTPTALSGGQCQRVGIARAMIRRPRVIVLDEPVSALDWSIRDDILALLERLQARTDAAFLFISHDLDLVERQCDQVYEVADGGVRRR